VASQPAEAAAGRIYDIGYERYAGARLGRANAVRTLLVHGLRTCFGIGRGARAKLVPGALVLLALVPAVIQAWVASAAGDLVRLVAYHTYFQQIEIIFMLFCAAQAPELVSRDQHDRVLPLYFSRPLHRGDYAFGKLAALCTALLVIGLSGPFILLAGRVFGAEALLDGWRAEQAAVLPIVLTTLTGALLMAAVSLAIASFLKARMLASAAIVAFFLVTAATTPLLARALGDPMETRALLGNPFLVLAGTAHWLFDVEPLRRTLVYRAGLDMHYYPAAAAAFIVIALAVLFLRYRRVHA
jgi:ABC-2 type transport system permease protein